MTKFFALTKLFFKEHYRSERKGDGKRNRQWIAFAIVGVYFLFILSSLAYSLYQLGGYCSLNAPEKAEQVIAMLVTVTQALILLFGFRTVLNVLYSNKDSSQLLYLPVSPVKTFFARFLVIYVEEVLYAVVGSLFLILPFGIGYGAKWSFFVTLLPVMLFLPVLPLTLACILAIPANWFISLFKKKSFLGIIVAMLGFAIVFGGIYYLSFSFDTATGSEEEVSQMLAQILDSISGYGAYMYPNVFKAQALLIGSEFVNGGGWGAILALLSDLLLFAVAALLARVAYQKTLLNMEENVSQTVKANGKFKGRNKLWLLIKDDFRNIFRDTSLGTYCLMGIVIIPIMVAVFGFVMSEDANIIAGGAQYKTFALFSLALLMLSSCNTVATSSVSRERELFFVYKYLPIDSVDRVKSKVFTAQIVSCVVSVVTVIVGIVFKMCNVWYALYIFVVINLVCFGMGSIQVYFDIKNPRLKWTNIQNGLKNNSSAIWSLVIMLGVIFVFVLPFGMATLIPDNLGLPLIKYLVPAVLFVLAIVFAVVSYRIVIKKAPKRLTEIE